MDQSDNNLQPELKDVLEMVNRYNIVHKEGCFVFRFVGFKEDKENICECGEHCSEYDEDKSLLGAYGEIEILRNMLNELRDVVEDFADEDGFINV